MSYTYADLKGDVNSRIHAKSGRILDIRGAINRGVRKAVKLPLKTLRRRYSSPIRILSDLYTYTAPSDIQGQKVIDLQPVSPSRANTYAWRSVHPEAFDRLRSQGQPVLCVKNDGTLRYLKASSNLDDDSRKVTLSSLDSITDGGTWTAVGTASSLSTDTSTFLFGSGSVKFNLGAGTQDGIDVTLSSSADISGYVADGSVYLSASVPSTSGLTGFTVRLGSSSSAYTEISVTSDISGNSFTTGFNMLKFDLANGADTGTPDMTAIDYVALLVDKNTTTYTGVRFDQLWVGLGSQHYLEYYSRFGWRSSGGTWKADSTLDTDILNAEEEEYDLVVEYCVEQAAGDAREYKDADRAKLNIIEMGENYLMEYPDCSILQTSDIWVTNSRRYE